MNIAILVLAFLVVAGGVRTGEKATNIVAVTAMAVYLVSVVGLAAISAWLTAVERGWL